MIVVAGESLVDLVVDSSGAISPREGGGPYNAARTVSRLGEDCMFLGSFGDDRFGGILRSALLADRVELACPVPLHAPTTLAVAEISERGDARYHFYLAETASSLVTEVDSGRALAAIVAAPPTSRAVHVGTLGLVMEPIGSSVETLVRGLPDDAVLMLDPNCRPAAVIDHAAYRDRLARLLRRADFVKVSHDDLAYMAPGVPHDDAARELLEAGPAAVLLTYGGEPTTVITADSSFEVPVPQIRIADTIGAGDSFGGAFLALWVHRRLGRRRSTDVRALADAVGFATSVAAVTCQRVGADPPRLADLDSASRGAWLDGR